MGKNQHVVPHGTDCKAWAVRGEGNKRVTKCFKKQKDAIDYARQIARNQKSELLIHNKDGQIRSRDSYGGDSSAPG
jgi:hypothetical protein